MQVYREILPNSYLLILVDTSSRLTDVSLLRDALRRAGRSGKDSVWIDCSGLPMLKPTLVAILTHYAEWLRRRHMELIVCHPPATLTGASLEETCAGELLVANTLLDAELMMPEHTDYRSADTAGSKGRRTLNSMPSVSIRTGLGARSSS